MSVYSVYTPIRLKLGWVFLPTGGRHYPKKGSNRKMKKQGDLIKFSSVEIGVIRKAIINHHPMFAIDDMELLESVNEQCHTAYDAIREACCQPVSAQTVDRALDAIMWLIHRTQQVRSTFAGYHKARRQQILKALTAAANILHVASHALKSPNEQYEIPPVDSSLTPKAVFETTDTTDG